MDGEQNTTKDLELQQIKKLKNTLAIWKSIK